MPKMKTHSGSKKRFRVTGSGKIMRGKAYKSHIRHETGLAAGDEKNVARALGLR